MRSLAIPGDDRPITVVLADDHPVVRQALRALLAAEPELSVVGAATVTDPPMKSGSRPICRR